MEGRRHAPALDDHPGDNIMAGHIKTQGREDRYPGEKPELAQDPDEAERRRNVGAHRPGPGSQAMGGDPLGQPGRKG